MGMTTLYQLVEVLPTLGGSATLGVVAYLGFRSTQWVVNTYFERTDLREEKLSSREEIWHEKTAQQICELQEQTRVWDERFTRLERDHDVLMGIIHTMIDDPSPARSIAVQLHLAYPKPEDMPPRMRALLARLEAKYGETIQPAINS